MNRKYLYIVVPILLLVIVSALLSLHKKPVNGPSGNGQEGGAGNLSENLSTSSTFSDRYDLPGLSLEGVSGKLSVKNGAVYRDGEIVSSSSEIFARALRVAYFYRWMREEPILYAESANLRDFNDAVQLMGRIEDRISAGSDIKTSLFARSFVNAFYKSSLEFAAFRSSPGEKTAKDLIAAMKKTATAYSSEVVFLTREMREIRNAPLGDKFYSMLGGENFTSADVILSDLDLMAKNASVLNSEVAKREACLGDVAVCQSSHNARETRVGSRVAQILPLSELSINNTEPLRGPYQVYSRCWRNADTNSLYLSDEDSMQGFMFPKFSLATKGYFAKIDPKDGAFDSLLYNQGVRVIPQGGATPYMCPDLEYKSTVATMDVFKRIGRKLFSEMISKKSLESDEEGKTILADGLRSENRFFDSKVSTETDFNDLKDKYWNAYIYLSERGISEREMFLDNYLIGREDLIGYPMVLREMSYYLNAFWDGESRHQGAATKIYLYILKSNYSISFMNVSPNIYVSNSKPKYFADVALGDDKTVFGIISYSDAVAAYGKAKLREWFGIFKRYDRADREKYYNSLK